jgi:hypothetical protein
LHFHSFAIFLLFHLTFNEGLGKQRIQPVYKRTIQNSKSKTFWERITMFISLGTHKSIGKKLNVSIP